MTDCIYRHNGTFHRGTNAGGGAAYSVVIPEGRPRNEAFTVSYLNVWHTTDMAEVKAQLKTEAEQATRYSLDNALRNIRHAINPPKGNT